MLLHFHIFLWAARDQIIQGEPVQLERSGQQNLLGIDEDIDLPPFLRR